MTTQFEKNAVNFARLGSQLSRAFKGLKSAPKDLISVATGRGVPSLAKELGRAGQLGNLAGHAAIATGSLMGANELLNGGSKDSKAPNRGRPISSGQHPLDLRMREGLEAGRDAASRGLSKDEALEEFMKRYGGMGGSGQGGSIPKGMRFDARPRDWNRMGGTGGMAGKTAVGIAERNKLQPYQLELMDNIKSSPRYDYTPDLDKQAGLNYNPNTNTTMTPFAQLEKSANPLEAIQVKPFAPSGGAVAGGLYGAGYGGAAGGGIGLLKALLDSEDDGVRSTVMKALKGSAIGAGLGGLAGAGYGASNRDDVTKAVIEELVEKHRQSSRLPIGDPFRLQEKALREAASEQLPKLKVPLGKLINKMLNEGGRNIVYPAI
jgi:hypothetical protein